MQKHESLQNRNHERVGAPVLQESANPPFKPTTRELRTEYFVLSEDQKKTAHRDPKTCQDNCISMLGYDVAHERTLRLYAKFRKWTGQQTVITGNFSLTFVPLGVLAICRCKFPGKFFESFESESSSRPQVF
jgi:hypothetical protein